MPLAFSNSVAMSKNPLSGVMIGSESVSMDAVVLSSDTRESSLIGETGTSNDKGESSPKAETKESHLGVWGASGRGGGKSGGGGCSLDRGFFVALVTDRLLDVFGPLFPALLAE